MAEKKDSTEKKDATVTLIAPNGQVVSVDASKRKERLAGGYTRPEATSQESEAPEPPKRSTKK